METAKKILMKRSRFSSSFEEVTYEEALELARHRWNYESLGATTTGGKTDIDGRLRIVNIRFKGISFTEKELV